MAATCCPLMMESPSLMSNRRILPEVSAETVTVVASKMPVASYSGAELHAVRRAVKAMDAGIYMCFIGSGCF